MLNNSPLKKISEIISILRTPELVGLAHVSVCTVANSEKRINQIIINSMKHGMCNIHNNDYYSKYFV